MQLVLGFLLAMGITMLLIPPLMHVAQRWRILDQPSERKVHAAPVPRVGGIAMAAGMLLAMLVWGRSLGPMPALLAGVGVLLVFGIWDDRVTLGAAPKFIGQFLAAAIVMYWGDVSIGSVTLESRHLLPSWVAMPLTLLFLMGVTNAVNLSDGLDGLAGGTLLLSLMAMALLGFAADQHFVVLVAVIASGSILGFLRFNTHPARVFMGDSGSQILGFTAAVLAVELTQNAGSALSAALPLLLLGIPIVDTLMVMIRRLLEGRSPFSADRSHVHHRLLAFGLHHYEAVTIIYLLQAALFVIAWQMRFEPDPGILAAFVGAALLLVATLETGRVRGWRRPASTRVASWWRVFQRWRASDRFVRGAALAIGTLTGLYLLSVVWRCAAPAQDIRLLMFALMALLLVDLLVHRKSAEAHWITKGAIYICAAVAVYVDRTDGSTVLLLSQLLLFGLLVVLIGASVGASEERRFRVTPLDVLVVLVTAVVPGLLGSLLEPGSARLALSIAKLVVLFYGIEAMLVRPDGGWRWPSAGAAGFLGLCTLRI